MMIKKAADCSATKIDLNESVFDRLWGSQISS